MAPLGKLRLCPCSLGGIAVSEKTEKASGWRYLSTTIYLFKHLKNQNINNLSVSDPKRDDLIARPKEKPQPLA